MWDDVVEVPVPTQMLQCECMHDAGQVGQVLSKPGCTIQRLAVLVDSKARQGTSVHEQQLHSRTSGTVCNVVT